MKLTIPILPLLTLVTLGQAQSVPGCSLGIWRDSTWCNETLLATVTQVGPGTVCVNHENRVQSCADPFEDSHSKLCTWWAVSIF